MEINPFKEENPGSMPSSPIVYSSDDPTWEYKLFVRDLELDNAPGEDELNPLGAAGWEMVALFVHANMLYCYFKKLK